MSGSEAVSLGLNVALATYAFFTRRQAAAWLNECLDALRRECELTRALNRADCGLAYWRRRATWLEAERDRVVAVDDARDLVTVTRQAWEARRVG